MHYRQNAQPKGRWLFLSTAVQPREGEAPTRLVMLRAEDGSGLAVPEEEFRRDWQLAAEGPGAVNVDAVRETLASIRAHSAIRFVALPFLILALAVLAKAFHTGEVPRWQTLGAGLGLSLVAVVMEVVLSRNLVAWWAALGKAIEGEPAWRPLVAHRNTRALWAARLALFAPYAVALGYWAGNVWRWVAWERRPLPLDPRLGAALTALVVTGLAFVIAVEVWRRAEGKRPTGRAD